MRVNKNKHLVAIDFLLVAGTLTVLSFFVNYATPMVISPIDDLTTTDNSVLFEFENAGLILIDDNLQFSSPEKIFAKDNLVINLVPGVYYWKIEGILDSDVRKLTIESEIDLKLRELEKVGSYEVVNAGNVELNVDIYDKGKLTGNIILGADESMEISGNKFVGGLHPLVYSKLQNEGAKLE